MPDGGTPAPPSLQEFEHLKREFATATDFSSFWNWFLDDWASRPGFMQLGAPAYVEEMEVLIMRIASKMVGDLAMPANTRLVKIPEAKLVHGSCLVNKQICCVLYFEDLEMGLFVMSSKTGKTDYARFTLKQPKSAAN
jgi:hypothetical protein